MIYDYMTPVVVNEINNLPLPELQSVIVDTFHNQRQEQYDLLNNSGRDELLHDCLVKMNYMLTSILGTMEGSFDPETDNPQEYYESMGHKGETILQIMGDEKVTNLHQLLLNRLCDTEDLQACIDICTNFLIHSTCSFINRFIQEDNNG